MVAGQVFPADFYVLGKDRILLADTEMILEFQSIREMLCANAVTEQGKRQLMELAPFYEEDRCREKLAETTQARAVMEAFGTPPLPVMKDMEKTLILCEKEGFLTAEQLEQVSIFIAAIKRLKKYLKNAAGSGEAISGYGYSLWDLEELKGEIDACIQSGRVLDSATGTLRGIRRKIEEKENETKRKLNDMLKGRKNLFSDHYISRKNGRFVLPVKKEAKNQLPGSVIDVSATGNTYFIEPAAIAKIQEELSLLLIEEDNEVRKILYTLAGKILDSIMEIRVDMEAAVTLDIIFAKAKLSMDMRAAEPEIGMERNIEIVEGRHPLIKRENCVPLSFALGGDKRGIVITGPNTGGKTVALKTVGLFSIMAQSGLHVPAARAKFSMNSTVLCDIGDGQSITENLSTFSAHITNIIALLERADNRSLVLLDELGSGTDPAEGMGIAIAILEELRQKGCLFVATTHYPEVKEYASEAEGLENARMSFDKESLMPLYRLEIGEAGESCALYIAKKLGLPTRMLQRAYEEAYKDRRTQTLQNIDREVFFSGEEDMAEKIPAKGTPAIVKKKKQTVRIERKVSFDIGDSVVVYPQRELGLVYRNADARGMVGVQIKGVKGYFSYKRVKLKTPASELYPPDYDFSILFDTVANRKARHQMEKGHGDGLVIELDEGWECK